MQLRGKFDLGEERQLNYAIFVSNGLEQVDDDLTDGLVPEGGDIRDLRRNDRDGADNDKAIGGRLGAIPIRGLNIGASAYTGAYTVDGAQRLTMFDVDASLEVTKLTFRIEAALALQEVAADVLNKWGGYFVGSYRLVPWLQPYVMLEMVSLDGAKSNRGVGGIALYPFPDESKSQRLKLEAGAVDTGGKTDFIWIAQYTLGF